MATLDSSDDEYYMSCTPPDLCEASKTAVDNLLPDKSKPAYEISYNRFLTWQKENRTTSFSQRVLLAYFSGLSNKWKSSTMWSEYSKLSKMLKIKQNVNVGEYQELKSFLKKKSVGYRAKKSRTLTAANVEQYSNEAPDHTCLATKVAMIFGILGACRKDELMKVETSHLKTYYDPADTERKMPMLLVRLPDTKTHQEREFTVKGNFYEFYRRYSDLRSAKTPHNRFFVNYQMGKCTVQPIGIKKFASMPQQVAKFLKLPNPESYTGHAFRRTSATLLVEGGADITTLKRHGGWRSTSVAEGYIEGSLLSKEKISDQITRSIHLGPSSSSEAALKENPPAHRTTNLPSTMNLPSTSKDHTNSPEKENSEPVTDLITLDDRISLNISNCSNCTFNILDKK